ncbi:MAG: hypothetical protein JW955_14995 [Sedimentisphaerales bacterium]|nr:hypothetical protein [Sedimentisphaerales bacterium]
MPVLGGRIYATPRLAGRPVANNARTCWVLVLVASSIRIDMTVMLFDVFLVILMVLLVPGSVLEGVIEYCIMVAAISVRHIVGMAALPNDLVRETVLSEDLIEHDFDVVGGMPVAVVVEGAGLLEDSAELDATGAHEVDVSGGGGVTVFKSAFLLCLAPEDLIVAIGVEGRVL